VTSLTSFLDRRPVIVVIAGSNGAGKTTFFEAYLSATGLRFVNADVLARSLEMAAYEASELAKAIRSELVEQGESFIFETVFSDPVGDKVSFLKEAAARGYTAVLCFIGIANVETSEQRVLMRASQGGHDVPPEKLQARFPRTLRNLSLAIRELPCVFIFDNSDLRRPYRLVATFEDGIPTSLKNPIPSWLSAVITK
jgi:predicted ABC-type ATPase